MLETWDDLKQQGSEHYKTGGVEPVDLYKSGGMLHDYCCTSMIKYAFRSRRESNIDRELLVKNMNKVIDCAQKLIAYANEKGDK